jgi:DNA-binding NarL/FixJ family response regulator
MARNNGWLNPWTEAELRIIATERCMMRASIKTGRTALAITDKARRMGIKPPVQKHPTYWPASMRERALKRRADGWSVKDISEALGVPFGTVRHWIYDRGNELLKDGWTP